MNRLIWLFPFLYGMFLLCFMRWPVTVTEVFAVALAVAAIELGTVAMFLAREERKGK
jgi:hypothetical protein